NELIIINWQDSGPGVTDEQLERLFERLYRAENSRNRSTGGSGLGLSICKNIVSAHQGKISATQSHLGAVNITIEFLKEMKHG
ncbi:MAG: ATP-binding protein, partial [Pseudomonadales bacterium]|nr:ATP-binding protein [Pseudomonadales bacterium]